MIKPSSVLALVPVLAAVLAAPARAAEPGKAPRVVRWVAAHTRGDEAYQPLFEDLKRRVAKDSGGALAVEFVGGDDSDSRSDASARRMLEDGSADVGQFERQLAEYAPAVTAPFAFRSYAHAEEVFNGPVGRGLLDGFYAGSDRKLRALAFTYSGGHRVFFGTKPLASLADFKGQRMESPGNSGWTGLMDELMTRAGARLVPPAGAWDTAKVDQFEGAINRVALHVRRDPALAKRLGYLNVTEHGLLVTTVVANEKFLSGLPADQRRLLEREIDAFARRERKLSIGLEPKRLALLQAAGLKVTRLSGPEREKLMRLAEDLLKAHPDVYESVKRIRAVKDEQLTSQL